MAIEIKRVTSIEECRAIEQITWAAWGGGHDVSVPDHLTITIARENGGLVLLASDDETPIGFCLGFLSFVGAEKKRLKHCSHLAAVIPAYRGRRIGEQLKWAQRDGVLAMGVDHITWTYDPLETLNGRLNLHKLGATCTTYKRDVYGDGRDVLNRGLATDRFYVDWWLNAPWVKKRHDEQLPPLSAAACLDAGARLINPPQTQAGHWQPGPVNPAAFTANELLVAVPRDFQIIKQADHALARAWRQQTRQIFEEAFGTGFTAVDLLSDGSLCYYRLQKGMDDDTQQS